MLASLLFTFSSPQVNLDGATNVLDRWIAAASRNLTAYVRQVRQHDACVWAVAM